MFRRVIQKNVGQAVQQKFRDELVRAGPTVVHDRGRVGDLLRWVIQALEPMDCMYEIELLQAAQSNGLTRNLIALAGKLPGPQFFEQVMRPFAIGSWRVPYTSAKWVVESWAIAIKESLPETGLNFDQPGQDRAAYLALTKAMHPPLEKIEAKIKERFGVQLAPTKVRRRQGGSRAHGRGWCLQYSFGRAADSREYLDWNYGHSMTNTAYGRIYEDGEEVSLGSSNF